MDTQPSQRPYKSEAKKPFRRFRLYIVFLVLIVGVLIILPYGIRYGIIQGLVHSGAEQAYIDNVDFNPFTGRLIVHNLSVKEGRASPLTVSKLDARVSWFPLFRKRIYLKELAIDGGSLSVTQAGDSRLIIGGIALPETTEEKTRQETSPWGIGTGHIEITASTVIFKSPDLEAQLVIGSFNFRNAKSWEPDLESTLEFSGKLNDGNVSISAVLRPFSDTSEVKGDGSVKSLSLPPFSRVLIPGDRLSIEKGSAGITGKFSFLRNKEGILYTFDGDAGLDNLTVLSPEEKLVLVELKKLNLHLIKADGTKSISVGTIETDTLAIARPVNEELLDTGRAKPLFEGDSIVASDVRVEGLKDISIQSIDMNGVHAFLYRAPDGTLPTLSSALKAVLSTGEKGKAVEKEAQSVGIAVAAVHVKGNSSLAFIDETVDPSYSTMLLLNRADIGTIDSARPEEKSPLSIEGKIDEYTTYQFSGKFQPFADRMTIAVSGKINQMNLPPLSSYTTNLFGYNVESGHLDADIDINITSGDIQGESALVLKKLKLSPEDKNKIQRLASELTVSVETALSLLRDKDGTIRLKLPVSGDISDPKIGMGDIMNKAMVSALKKAAFSYLKYAIQPYGALITVIEIAGKAAAKIRLDPVEFAPGTAVLDAKAKDYLKVVNKLMKERPEIQVSICGKATQSDIRLLNEKAVKELKGNSSGDQLAPKKDKSTSAEEKETPPPPAVTKEQILKLADERAQNIKKHLSDEHGIGSDRLFICNPEIDKDEKAAPRADLLI